MFNKKRTFGLNCSKKDLYVFQVQFSVMNAESDKSHNKQSSTTKTKLTGHFQVKI